MISARDPEATVEPSSPASAGKVPRTDRSRRECGELSAALKARRGLRHPPVERGTAYRRHRFDGRDADQRVRRAKPASVLDDCPGTDRGLKRGSGIGDTFQAHDRDRVALSDPLGGGNDGEGRDGSRGQ